LLKNYLFSVVSRESSHANEIETLERRWEAMVGSLGGESFPDFLRTHWNSRQRFVREADLFKTIRNGTGDKASVFELIRQMEQDVGLYAALTNPEDDIWTPDQRIFIRELRMFNVRQPWPLLLAAHRNFDNAGVAAILRACSIVSFRYNVIGGLATNEQERVYNSVAQKIADNQLEAPADVISSLASVYVKDDQFRSAFAVKVLRTSAARNRHVVRYILFELERHVSHRDFDIGSDLYSIEHILPESPTAQWTDIPEDTQEANLYRLGNMTPLEIAQNRLLGNKPFTEKRLVYERSTFETTRRVGLENAEWTAGRIAARQAWMAAQATAIWRISQLS